jgi:hypothetical protein
MRRSITKIAILLVLATSLLVAGCGGSGATLEDMPEWVAEKPTSESAMFGAGTGKASTLQTAIQKSKMRAQGDIASSMEAQFNSMTKDFREEVGGEELSQFTQAQERIVSQVLRGVQTEEQKVMRENGNYRVYTLMRMPIGQAAGKFLSQLQANEEAYTRFRQSEAFEEMRRRVEEYEKSQEAGAVNGGSSSGSN